MDSKKRLYDNRLLVGPQSTWKDLKRSVQIGAEFFYGFRKLRHVKKCVTIFGSDGLLTEALENLPQRGDTIEWREFELTVLSATPRQAEFVRIRKRSEPQE